MAKVTNFDELCLENLKDIYDAEHQIIEALPKMAEAATAPRLKDAFNTHLKQTEVHIERLDRVFGLLGESPQRKTCLAAKGLIAEGRENIKEIEPGPLLDAALIESAQKVEHYEIASYGTVRTFATQSGKAEIAVLLGETLQEEGDTDKALTTIAEVIVNPKAVRVDS